MIQKENLEGSIAIRGLRVQAPPPPTRLLDSFK